AIATLRAEHIAIQLVAVILPWLVRPERQRRWLDLKATGDRFPDTAIVTLDTEAVAQLDAVGVHIARELHANRAIFRQCHHRQHVVAALAAKATAMLAIAQLRRRRAGGAGIPRIGGQRQWRALRAA